MSSYRRLPLIEESYITSVYLIIEGGNGVLARCEPKTYTNVKTVRLAGFTMASSERFFRHSPKKNHRERVEELYDLIKKKRKP